MSVRPFQILSISGGGYRGLHAAQILADLETHLGAPLSDYFDLVCGTSAGAINALAIANGVPASDVVDLFVSKGGQIFNGKPKMRFLKARHQREPLEEVLLQQFGTLTLGELKTFVLVPAVDASTGKARVFKTPHHEDFKLDHACRVVDVLLSTTAAPTYFPIYAFPSSKRLYVDGGLIANAPGLFGVHEAMHFFEQSQANIRLLSIGTASVGRNVRVSESRVNRAMRHIHHVWPFSRWVGKDVLDKGVYSWGAQLFDLTISAQQSVADYMLMQMLTEERYVNLDSKIDTERSKDIEGLDVCTPAATDTLIAHAKDTAQHAISDRRVTAFFKSPKPPRRWFYGPQASNEEMAQ